ncbi:MAG: hypothetical protein ACLUD0_05505 [Eubacterium ramulus]
MQMAIPIWDISPVIIRTFACGEATEIQNAVYEECRNMLRNEGMKGIKAAEMANRGHL